MGEKLLNVRDAAPRLGTTEPGLRWMIHQGTAPKSAKIAGRRMFRESDIDDFIETAFGEAS